MKKLIAGILLSLVFVSPAWAGPYVGFNVGYAWADVGLSDDADVLLGGVRLGYSMHDVVSTELRVSTGLNDYSDSGFTVSIDSIVSGLLLIGPTTGEVQPYVMMGMSRIAATVSGYGMSVTDTDTDLAYGVGVSFFGQGDIALNLELLRYYSGSNVDVNGVTVGLLKRF